MGIGCWGYFWGILWGGGVLGGWLGGVFLEGQKWGHFLMNFFFTFGYPFRGSKMGSLDEGGGGGPPGGYIGVLY